jgi:D-glycero-alpha-D-manno-heptose-7-phosphate kinase
LPRNSPFGGVPVKATCARAPVRIDLAGGWTDCPPYSADVGGAVVNLGITRHAYATYTPRADGRFVLESTDFDMTVEAESLDEMLYDGNLDLHKAALKALDVREGGHLYTRCGAPPGAGMGSSSAVAIAILAALDASRGGSLTRAEICDLSHTIELRDMHINSGQQDQYGAAFGGFNFLDIAYPQVRREEIPVSGPFALELERLLLVVYTGRSRLSGRILGSVMNAYRQGDVAITSALANLRQAGAAMREALRAEDLAEVGKVLDFNWHNQKALYREMSTATIEAIFAAARHEGMLGGKVCGAGGGGCVAIICAPNREHHVRSAIVDLGCEIVDCVIDRTGLQVWDVTGVG